MTDITASMVKELRQRTNVGMMECKKALVETHGDLDAAVDLLRKKGMAKAAKKSSRVAAEGVIMLDTEHSRGALVEINCETDFVARDESFLNFGNQVVHLALVNNQSEVANLNQLVFQEKDSITVEQKREALVAQLGENIQVRRMGVLEAETVLGAYLHGTRIGVLVALKGGDEALAKDIAMHIAANKPLAISQSDVDPSLVAHEREIFIANAKESGKSPEILAKMVEGRVNKFLDDMSLLGQSFVKDPSIKISKLLAQHKAEVTQFVRFEVGEGIEKQSSDFVAEVMAQARGA